MIHYPRAARHAPFPGRIRRDRLSAARAQLKATPAPVSPTQLASAVLRTEELKEKFKVELFQDSHGPAALNEIVKQKGEPDAHQMKEIGDRVHALLQSEDKGGTECHFAVAFALVRWFDACDVPRDEQLELVRYVQDSLPDFKNERRIADLVMDLSTPAGKT